MYIIYIFRTIVLIFAPMFITTFQPLYAPAFFRWLVQGLSTCLFFDFFDFLSVIRLESKRFSFLLAITRSSFLIGIRWSVCSQISGEFYAFYSLRQFRVGAYIIWVNSQSCPVSCSCRIHRLHLCWRVWLPPAPNECPGYNTKQSDGEVPVMLELWGNEEHPFIAIARRSPLAPRGSSW